MSPQDKETLKDLDVLLRENYASLCAAAFKITSKTDVSEDIVQDVIIKYWENRTKYKEIKNLNNYLYIMVRNSSISFLRKNKREVEKSIEYEIDRSETALINNLIEEETYRLLNNAINVLPDKMKIVTRMVLKGQSNIEISNTLGVSINTIKTLKYISIRRLRKFLSDI